MRTTQRASDGWRETAPRAAALLAVCLALPVPASSAAPTSPREVAERVRAWRADHERAVLDELLALLEIPNVATDREAIGRNARALVAMLERRGAHAEIWENDPGAPAVFAEIRSPGAERTLVFYAHYDGQPADPADWTTPPWTPALRDGLLSEGAELLPLREALEGPIDPDWRVYARSASDDKSPIVAVLAALDALRTEGIPLSVNLKLFLEGEEEASSPYLARMLERHREQLAADLWVFGDGPVHQSGRVQVVYGARGVMGLEVTCYGPLRPLHSGHYGNWAPNPVAVLAELVAGLRDSEGRIRIEGFYDDVEPPSELARQAIADYPAPDAQLVRELALGRTEGGGRSLMESVLLPALNLRGLRAAQVGSDARNAIPPEARVSIDFRMVPGQRPERVRELVEAHLAREGYHVVHAVPDPETRRAHPRVVRLEWEEGYAAMGTPMDQPLARAVPAILDEALGEPVVRVPLLGGSLPLIRFQETLGTPLVIVPMVNHDNNQHADDENLRIGHLWRGIEMYAALLAELGHAGGAVSSSGASLELPAELQRVLSDYEAAWQARDADALAALFAEDGFVLSGGTPPVRGRARIRSHYDGRGGPLSLRALAFATEGSLGWVIGAYSRAVGEPDVGKFTLTLRRDPGGRWLIVSDMDNGNAQPR